MLAIASTLVWMLLRYPGYGKMGGMIEERSWCETHNAPWDSFPAIHEGCGWANPMKPCVMASGSFLVIGPLPVKEGKHVDQRTTHERLYRPVETDRSRAPSVG